MSLTQQIPALLGDAQGQNPLLLSTAYSPGGSLNLYIDKLGQIKAILGYLRQAAAAFTTDTGGSAAMIRSLYQYRRIAGGSTTRQVLFILDDQVNEQEMYYSTDLGVTKTLITDFGSGSVGAIPSWALFGDELYFANGVVAPRMWNGTSLVTAGGTQLAAPTLADNGAGQLRGNYKYQQVPIITGGIRKIAGIRSANLDVQNRQIRVTLTTDADGSVIGYELYRTTGSGIDFYLVGYVDGRTTATYDDNAADGTIRGNVALSLVGSHGDAPPSGARFCVSHKQRMFWLGTSTFPRRFWWSDVGDADSVYQDRSYKETTDAESLGDELRGATGEFEGVLVFWLEGSVWTLSGTGQIISGVIDWNLRRSNARTGAVHVRTVARVSQGAIFTSPDGTPQNTNQNMLAYMSPQKDIRLFDRQNDTIISFPKKDTLARINVANSAKSFVYDDSERGMLVWCFPIDAATEPNYSVAWNYIHGTWHEWDGANFGHVVSAESSTEKNILLAGEARTATGGLIYRLWTGNTRDGADITYTFMTKPLFPPAAEDGPPDMRQEKTLENVFFIFEKDAVPTTVTVGFLPHDAADADAAFFTRAIAATSRVRVPARQKDSDTNPGRYFFGTGWRLRVTSTGSTGPWTLRGIEQEYAVHQGTSR